MTPDEIAKLIPYDVVEAAAKHDYNIRAAAVLRDFGKALPNWEQSRADAKTVCRAHALATLAAGLAAWPRMAKLAAGRISPSGLFLPLEETLNDQG